jgi:hypothetical protein
MYSTRKTYLVLTIVVLASTLAPCRGVAAAPRTVIIPREKWNTCFSGQKATLHFILQSSETIQGRLSWACLSQRLTVAHDVISVTVEAAKPAEIEIALQLPDTREELVLEADLGLRLVNDRGDAVAEHKQTLRVFSRDPYARRQDWLKKQKISLYDPEGKTRKIFEEHSIPCNTIGNLSVLETITDGIVIIGEDISWNERLGLPEAMVKLAKAGVAVLCLAPSEGRMTFPGSDDDRASSARVALEGLDIVAHFDKRFDNLAWPFDGAVIQTYFELAAQRDRVVLQAVKTPRGWPWLEVEYPGGGRLALCGLGIIHSWEGGPTPRYLLLSMLESLSQKKINSTFLDKE